MLEQAGLIIMYAADREALLRGERVRVSLLIWKSHRIKRVVRSTLAAETMAALEAVEHADVMRGHFAELFEGIDYHSYYEDIQQISVIHLLTDCRSLYDLLHRRGMVPSERRLLIDIEALRSDIETNGVVSRWINTKQMLADCLTKDDVRAADYLRYVLRHGTYQIVEDLKADQIIYNERMKLKEKKSKYFCEKYPKRRRLAEQHYIDAGITYFNDALAETSYSARRFRAPVKNGVCWRWTLGQVGDEGFYQELEDMGLIGALSEKQCAGG